MRRLFCFILFLLMFVSQYALSEEKPIRLHVIAEDDSKYHQDMKLKIRDSVLLAARDVTTMAESPDEAYARLFTSIALLRSIAREEALKDGFTGEISVEIGREYFPARLYGDLMMKEGEYPCVAVRIGKAEGKNWWCVLFPDLCYLGEYTGTGEIEFYSKWRYVFRKWLIG